MPGDFTYKRSIIINAPVAGVWKVLTDPLSIPRFYFGMEWKTDWQKGSPVIFTGEHDHQHFEDKGNILDIEKEKLILFNYFNPEWEDEDILKNYKTFRFEVEHNNNDTVFTVYEYGFKREEEFERVITKWNFVLQTVKQEAEKQSTTI